MNKIGAKLLAATIKNSQKANFVYKFLIDNKFAGNVLRQKSDDDIEKLLYYVHNYLCKPNLVVIAMGGGVGNQMFHYAFGKAVESKGYNVIFDTSFYKAFWRGGPRSKELKAMRYQILDITYFNITLPLDFDFDKELFFDLVDEQRIKLPPNIRIKKPYKYLIDSEKKPELSIFETFPLDNYNIHKYSYFGGSWFSLSCFKHIENTLRKEFTLKLPLSTVNATLKERIKNTQDSVFLHIRRGDFIDVPENLEFFGNVCEGKYYDGAIRLIKSKLAKPHIFIFSNDIAWCEREFLGILSDECKEGVEFEFVANNGEDSAVQEMELMRSCQNAIIANSTFSWWASYLIDNPRKIVAMPNHYGKFPQITYNDETQVYDRVVLIDTYTGEVLQR